MLDFFCPSCKNLLHQNANTLACLNPNCQEDLFPLINGIPILFQSTSPYRAISQKYKFVDVTSPYITRRSDTHILHSFLSILRGKNLITYSNMSFIAETIKPHDNILFVGGGSIGHGCQYIYAKAACFPLTIYSLDVYLSPNTNLLADAHALPFPDNFFNVVVIQAVLEHLLDPPLTVSEIYRVLDLNGLVYSEVPFMQCVHEGPFDFLRFSLSAHKYLFRQYKIITSGVHHGPMEAILFLLSNLLGLVFKKYIRILVYTLLIRSCRFIDSHFFAGRRGVDIACGTFVLAQKNTSHIIPPLSLEYINSLYAGLQ